MIRSFVFAASLALALPSLAHAGVIRVPADFTTIQPAIDAASEGDTIQVSAGTYPGALKIENRAGIALVGKGKVVIDGQNELLALDLFGSHDITLRGLTVVNGLSAVIRLSKCDAVVVERCAALGNTKAGFFLQGSSGCRLDKCRATGGFAGFAMIGRGNRLVACRAKDVKVGFNVSGDDCVLESCRVTDGTTGLVFNGSNGALVNGCRMSRLDGNGVEFGEAAKNSVLRGSTISDCGGAGIVTSETSETCLIENNVIRETGEAAVFIVGAASTFRENTIENAGGDGFAFEDDLPEFNLLLGNFVKGAAGAGIRMKGVFNAAILNRVKQAAGGTQIDEALPAAKNRIVLELPKLDDPPTVRVPQDALTIAKALQIAGGSGVIEVEAGTYPGDFEISGATLLLRAKGNVVLQTTLPIALFNATNTRLVGFTIESTASAAVSIENSPGAALVDCRVAPGPAKAVVVSSELVFIDGCRFDSGVSLFGIANVLRDTRITGAIGTGVAVGGFQSVIDGCRIVDCTGDGVSVQAGNDIAALIAILRNRIEPGGAGVFVDGLAPVLLVEDNKITGDAIGGVVLDTSEDAVFVFANKLLDSSLVGIDAAASFSVLAFNKIKGAAHGISLQSVATETLLFGNSVSGAGVAAIELFGSENAAIANRAKGTPGNAFTEQSVGTNVLLDNVSKP